ncbi:dynein regulatory complex subunit 2 [Zerene cesonia]|uniref:dynein regulatory complex subunit 2 n=1 Tax=Zerene cesonia TaxID=33412 RepID=UPI0018E4EC0F|nr:dynein regulatory complex subunit 2 [Zerene cesonia]
MPKKSKVNKLARMSDEERARYLQHRADVEEEARRRKRELVARFIKNKLDKEEAFSKINTAKINQEWRYILRRIKCQQMVLEIQGMMASFNFLMERKNRLISSLTSAVDDSDEQHRRAFQAHTENLSYFLRIGSQRLDKLQALYEHQKNCFLETWDKEELDITDNQDRAEFKLTLITFIQDRDFKLYKKQIENERATAKNDARLEHEDEMRHLCRPKQLEIDFYWSKLRDVYDNYLEQHNPIMSHYQSLQEKDDFYQRDIARNDLQIQQASETLITLQKEWVKVTNLMNYKIKRMNSHKEDLSKRYWQMKKDSKMNRRKEDEILAVMVDASQGAKKYLEDMLTKLQKINQMAQICSKYEHDNDKILKEIENDELPQDFENLDAAMITECKEYSKMDKFLLKANRAKVQTMCLRTEKNKLIKENIQLKQYIKKYLTDLALNDGKVRPQTTKLPSATNNFVPKINRPVTCIEGALSNAVIHEKRLKLEKKRNKEIGVVRSYPRVNCW